MKKYIENVKILKVVSSIGIPKLPKLIKLKIHPKDGEKKQQNEWLKQYN